MPIYVDTGWWHAGNPHRVKSDNRAYPGVGVRHSGQPVVGFSMDGGGDDRPAGLNEAKRMIDERSS